MSTEPDPSLNLILVEAIEKSHTLWAIETNARVIAESAEALRKQPDSYLGQHCRNIETHFRGLANILGYTVERAR